MMGLVVLALLSCTPNWYDLGKEWCSYIVSGRLCSYDSRTLAWHEAYSLRFLLSMY